MFCRHVVRVGFTTHFVKLSFTKPTEYSGWKMTVIAYLGLGSNLGDRGDYLNQAIAKLRALEGCKQVRVSSIYETVPVGPPQPGYLNAVAEIETTLKPQELLEHVKSIEREIGRVPRPRHTEREIDIDILLFGNVTLTAGQLELPHPEVSRRAFVLVPLVELNPDIAVADGQTALQALDVVGRGGVTLYSRV